MELRQLRYFLAIAEHENVSRAAEELNVAQPSLSQQLKLLEYELGAALFDRIGKRLRLNAAGRLYAEHARRAMRELQKAAEAIRDLEELKRGSVNIGVVQTVKARLIPSALAAFTASYPNIRVSVSECSGPEIEERLAAGTLDVGVGFHPAELAGVTSEPFADEKLALFVGRKHRLAKHKSVTIRDLAEVPLALLPKAYCTRRLIEAAFLQQKVSLAAVVEIDSIEALLLFAKTSAVATILPQLAQGGAEALAIPITKPAINRTLTVLWAKDAYRGAAAAAFAEEILRQYRKIGS